MTQVAETIINIIADIKSISTNEITLNQKLYDDLLMDSLDLTDLINQTECELNVEIDYTNFDIKSLTVDDFILGVESLVVY